jgi:uncharacterized 2Fe-2S/4Fe-4S cluster protein (DUF4445 family)
MTQYHNIELLRYDRMIAGRSGRSLLEALMYSGIFLHSDCGGRGVCGKCQVTLVSSDGARENVTSCMTTVTSDLKITIPESSLLSLHVLDKAPLVFPPSFLDKMAENEGGKQGYGIAVDLGTTTIAVYLCDRATGAVLSSIAIKNPQALYGDDVMSRISRISAEEFTLTLLQRAVVNSIELGIHELLSSRPMVIRDLAEMVVVGNPTMIHIMLGVDPEPIGVSPYQPAFHEARVTAAQTIGFAPGMPPIRTLPQISGFLGGDIISAAIATNLASQPDGTLLVDLGTNGELMLKANGRLFAASCATGPAFEGASLACGVQALPGAINKITIRDHHDFPCCTTIPSKRPCSPVGVCGAGVISGIAELLRKGIISNRGDFVGDNTIKPLQNNGVGRRQYTLVDAGNGAGEAAVFISQKDIRAVQLGKAALASGIEFLYQAAGCCRPERIIIAGAFGNYIDTEDMIAIGMLPKIEKECIEIVGNAAGAGAVMVLSDRQYYDQAIAIAQSITAIELTAHADFQDVFVANLGFPR